MKFKSPAVKKTPVGKQKTPNPPKSGKKSIGQTPSPKIGKTPPSAMAKGTKKQTPLKGAMKGGKRGGGQPKKKLEELSESDIDSDEDFGLVGEEFGSMSDDSSSEEGDEESQVQSPKKNQKSVEMDVDEEDDDDDEEEGDLEDEAPALVTSKPVTSKKTPKKDQQAAKTNGENKPSVVDLSKSIYVGNLAPTVNEEDVQKLFSDCGVVESVKIVKIHRTQVSKGYGFVNFADEKSAAVAIAKQGLKLQGKVLTIGPATPKGDKTESSPSVDRSKTVYVGNIPFTMISEENIRRLFDDCGHIDSIAIPKTQGSPRGFALLNFAENDSVQKALKKCGTKVEDRELVVRFASGASKTIAVDHIIPIKGGIFGAAKCLTDFLSDSNDVINFTLEKKTDPEFAAVVEFESPDSAKKVVAKSGSQVGQGFVYVNLVQTSKLKKGEKQRSTGQKPKFQKQLNQGGNKQKKQIQGTGSPKKPQQQPVLDKSAALKNKTKQKLEKKKETSKKKLGIKS